MFPFTSPEDLPDQGIRSGSSELQGDSLASEKPGKPYIYMYVYITIPKPLGNHKPKSTVDTNRHTEKAIQKQH